MSKQKSIKLLVNLPPSFFTISHLQSHIKRIEKFGTIIKSSHNTPEEIINDLTWADAVLMWSWPSLTVEMLSKCPKLSFVGQINTSQTTAKACIQKEIPISEARHCWSPAVAEMALTLTLTGLRKTGFYHIAMRENREKWINDFPADIDSRERELTGANVGIVGFGGIGQRYAKLIKPFGTTIRVFDPYFPKSSAEQLQVELTNLHDLITNSDVIVLCAANTSETTHLIGIQDISLIKKDAVLVNVGRSSLIDMPALLERLKKQDITAMLDVFDTEPLEANSELRKLDNVFLTPHRSGGLISSIQRALDMLCDDLDAFLDEKDRKFEVTEKMLPCFSN